MTTCDEISRVETEIEHYLPKEFAMSLHPRTRYDIPAETARVAKACFPQGHPYLRLADALGPIFQDHTFAALFPKRGQPAVAPGRLAMIVL